MQRPDELFDVVDDRDRVIGRATRAEVHARGLRHRAVHILLFNKAGNLYVQKRSSTKDTFPGCHDSSASGHLDAGEDYDACARRELAEELGLTLPAEAFTRLFKLPASQETGWEFVWVYRVHGDHQPQPNPAEIESGEFRNLADVAGLIAGQPSACAPAFRRIIRELLSCKSRPFPV